MSREQDLLLIEDDATFARALQRSFERRGYSVRQCGRIGDLPEVLAGFHPGRAVVDLKLFDASGLECIQQLRAFDADMKIVVLTGFASIATAVEAIKLGACHYLAKPSNADDI